MHRIMGLATIAMPITFRMLPYLAGYFVLEVAARLSYARMMNPIIAQSGISRRTRLINSLNLTETFEPIQGNVCVGVVVALAILLLSN